MNRTYCLLQYFVLIIHRLCLLCAGPAASSWQSILSGTCFLFSISKFLTAWGLSLPLYVKLCEPGCPAASFKTSDMFTCNLSRDSVSTRADRKCKTTNKCHDREKPVILNNTNVLRCKTFVLTKIDNYLALKSKRIIIYTLLFNIIQ